jgi:endonuclease YncB( thermonuclease family)
LEATTRQHFTETQENAEFLAGYRVIVKNQLVRLEIQTVPTSRDRFGWLLAYVFRQSDGLLVNKEIIRQGYGHAYTKYPFDQARTEEFRAAEREAREDERGLWGPNEHIACIYSQSYEVRV